jgi:4'-phosphopantetheinyl transferase
MGIVLIIDSLVASLMRQTPRSTCNRAWAPAPPQPQLLETGTVHVWRADLEKLGDGLIELLCAEERARAERFAKDRDRLLWMRAHGVLRELLGRYLQTSPRTLRFVTGAHGKPALLDSAAAAINTNVAAASTDVPTAGAVAPARELPARELPARTLAAPRGLCFNLSHSGGIALYAFHVGGEIGIDVEVARKPIDEVAIAARALGPAEAQRLAMLDRATREREFLRAWVRHEAKLKCRGTGIGSGAVELDGNDEPWVMDLDVGPRAAAAVSVEGRPHELHCWDF